MARRIFEKVLMKRPRYSGFDLSHERKLSFNMGELIPVYLDDVLPGDEFRVNTELMIRMAPMIAPVMHRVNVYVHYFFVPNRIVWNQWETFMTGGQDGLQTPTIPAESFNEASAGTGKLADYLGIPDPVGDEATGTSFQVLPFRGYTEIWNAYYRDENLQDKIDVHQVSFDPDVYSLKYRCWEKDYFTSALPFAQRGAAASVPGSVEYLDPAVAEVNSTDHDIDVVAGTNASPRISGTQAGGDVIIKNIDSIDVDINDLRRSSAIQRWLEKSARGGYRYVETILSQFGVRSSDARLQRPEYLGGGRQPLTISEVLNTSATATEPQGNMAGHGVMMGSVNSFKKRFEEHGYVFGIMSVLPKTNYQQGIPRHWLRKDKFDFAWPEFANLGEQEILGKEIYWNRGAGSPPPNDGDDVWGYQQRYAEYKYGRSSVHGDFRESLDFYHCGRIFGAYPPLNESFVQADPTNRIFAVQDGTDTLWCYAYNNVLARRPLPYHADPRLT